MSDCSYQNIGPDYFKDDYHTHDETSKTTIVKDDSRPIFNNMSKHSDAIKTNESITTTTEKRSKPAPIQLKGNSTIASESIGSIFGNMAEKVSNFGSDFNKEFVTIKYQYDMDHTNDSNYTFSDIVKLHLLAFTRYMDSGPNIAYIGVFLIFISFFIYLLNIIIRK